MEMTASQDIIAQIDSEIQKLEALVQEFSGSGSPTGVGEESTEADQPATIEVKMKAGKGYAWLASAINKKMEGQEGYSPMDYKTLEGRMGHQMLYKDKTYTYGVGELCGGGKLTGGMSAEGIKKAQRSLTWWRSTGRAEYLAKQEAKVEAERRAEQVEEAQQELLKKVMHIVGNWKKKKHSESARMTFSERLQLKDEGEVNLQGHYAEHLTLLDYKVQCGVSSNSTGFSSKVDVLSMTTNKKNGGYLSVSSMEAEAHSSSGTDGWQQGAGLSLMSVTGGVKNVDPKSKNDTSASITAAIGISTPIGQITRGHDADNDGNEEWLIRVAAGPISIEVSTEITPERCYKALKAFFP